MKNMKYRVILTLLCCIVCGVLSAQRWIPIAADDESSHYLRVDRIPSSPRNETFFKEVYTAKEAARLKKEYEYEALPAYALKSYCYPYSYNYFATRTFNVYDEADQALYEAFHGFLSFDSIRGGYMRYYSRWSYLLKRYGADACLFASQTRFRNANAEWVKFSESDKTTRYIRVDLSNSQDSLAIFKAVYKAGFAKEIQKEYEFKEPPTHRIFVYKISDNGQAITQLAETWYGKKGPISSIWLYPFSDPQTIEEDVYKVYVKWAFMLFEYGKSSILELSNDSSAK